MVLVDLTKEEIIERWKEDAYGLENEINSLSFSDRRRVGEKFDQRDFTPENIMKIIRDIYVKKEITKAQQDIVIADEHIRTIQGSDRQHLIEMLYAYFETGMYQRTWKGPGFPFPIKFSQTKGSCQDDIDVMMNISIIKISDEYEMLSEEAKNFVDTLPLIDLKNQVRAKYLKELLDEITEHDFCVALVSGPFIETAYHFLTLLDENIDGFDIETFETLSTHR